MAKEQMSLADMLASFSENIQIKSSKTYVPHDKQTVFHGSRMEEKLFIGGNRSGKTVANVLECILVDYQDAPVPTGR